MTVSILPTDQSPVTTFAGPHFRTELSSLSADRRAAYSPDEVAALATERIESMSRAELIDVIRSIRGRHLRPGVVERLPDMDAETLRRLVFVTRRYCRNQQSLEGAAESPGHVAICWG